MALMIVVIFRMTKNMVGLIHSITTDPETKPTAMEHPLLEVDIECTPGERAVPVLGNIIFIKPYNK